MPSRTSPTARQSASRDRAAAFRSRCLILANACSIGFTSGQYTAGRARARQLKVALAHGTDSPGRGLRAVLEPQVAVLAIQADFPHGEGGGGEFDESMHWTRGRSRQLSRPGPKVNAGRDGLVADVSTARQFPRPPGPKRLKNETRARPLLRNSVPDRDRDTPPATPRSGQFGASRAAFASAMRGILFSCGRSVQFARPGHADRGSAQRDGPFRTPETASSGRFGLFGCLDTDNSVAHPGPPRHFFTGKRVRVRP